MPTEFLREIAGPSGPLEARLDLPDGPPRAVAVCGHPHPLHGGTMHTKALYQTAKAPHARRASRPCASTSAASA